MGAHAQHAEVDRRRVEERGRDDDQEHGVEALADGSPQEQAGEAEHDADRRTSGDAAEDVERER